MPQHRRKGVLRALLARAMDWCRERGLTEMRLHNVGSSASSAATWDSLGFEIVEQVRVRRIDAHPMEHHADFGDEAPSLSL